MKARAVRLGVNIDHVATIRQARRGRVPDPLSAARLCERAGADSIVCHLREDRRHIQDADVRRLRRALRVPLNLEMSIAPEIVSVALAVRPHQVTLVPERRQELTTEGGLDVAGSRARLEPIVSAFHKRRIAVSLFVDPVSEQLQASHAVGARIVELHTGAYAEAKPGAARVRALEAIRRSALEAEGMGLSVAAGHGLDYRNIADVARIAAIGEVNIGFSIIARALEVGLSDAVREMLQALRKHRRGRG